MSSRRLFYLLDRAHRAIFRAADDRLRAEEDIGVSQQAVLLALSERDGRRLGDLCDMLRLKAPATSALLDRMAAKGLVERRADPDDGRAIALHLTDRGRDILKRTNGLVRAMNDRLLDLLSPGEQAVVLKFLDRLATDGADLIRQGGDSLPSYMIAQKREIL